MVRSLNLDGVVVTDESDCYVIAEIGNNHQGDVEKAKELILAAYQCGADAVKFQKRSNENLFTKNFYDKPYDNPNSYGTTYGKHREFLEFGVTEYNILKEFSKEIGITFFATPFDNPSANFLEKIDIPFYKIASADLKNIPLIKYVSGFGKPIIISTGGADFVDVQRVYDAVMPINTQLCIMQCTASYPCKISELNLNVIKTYRESFPDVTVGLSSHDNGIVSASVAYMLGARVIEKHFTLNHELKGTDHAFSLEPDDLKRLVIDLKKTKQALGSPIKKILDTEIAPIKKMGKSLVANSDLNAGHVLCEQDVAIKSPGGGVPPYELEKLIGKTLKKPIKEDVEFDRTTHCY